MQPHSYSPQFICIKKKLDEAKNDELGEIKLINFYYNII